MKGKIPKYLSAKAQGFIMQRMLDSKADGYFKMGTFNDEIVWGGYSYVLSRLATTKQRKDFQRGMFLFGMVRGDVKKYLLNNPVITLPKQNRQIEYNGDIKEDFFGKITGTDLNHAYWRIAYNLGIISKVTYNKGLGDEFKQIRLAALSTMGAPKKYYLIKKGVVTKEVKIVKGNEPLQMVYKLIRYTCYNYMVSVKRKLGKDFLAYKTDCIYYMDTPENRKKVREFFKEKDLLMKQLV